MLNHTESLALDDNMVESDWLLDWYGLNPKSSPLSFSANEHIVTQWDEQLFLNTRALSTDRQQLRGATVVNHIIVIARQHDLLLLDEQGELIERINTPNNSSNIKRLGTRDDHIIIQTGSDHYFQADEQIIGWSDTRPGNIHWSTPTTISDDQQQSLIQIYRGNGLNLERIILDLHSGRIFNRDWGIYIMDASAVILLWLGFSGIWVWLSRQRKMKTKKHYRKHH